MRKETCSVCRSRDYKRREGIQCDQCDSWKHRTCIKMSKEVFQNLTNTKELWLCSICRVFRQPSPILSGSEDEDSTMPNPVEPASEATSGPTSFSMTPARLPSAPVICTPRRQLPPIPIENCQETSIHSDLHNEFDRSLGRLSPSSSSRSGRHISMGNLDFQSFAVKKQPPPQPEPMDIDPQHENHSTTADMIEILSQLSDHLSTTTSAEPALQENAAPPLSPPAYSDDVEGAPAEAEEEATDVAPPLQHSLTHQTSPPAAQKV